MKSMSFAAPLLFCGLLILSFACANPMQVILDRPTAIQETENATEWMETPADTEMAPSASISAEMETPSPTQTQTYVSGLRHFESGQNLKNVQYSFSIVLASDWGVYTGTDGNPHEIGCPDYPVHLPCSIHWTPDYASGKTLAVYAQGLIDQTQKNGKSLSWQLVSSTEFLLDDPSSESLFISAKYFFAGEEIKWDLFIFKKEAKIMRAVFYRRMFMDSAMDADVEQMMKTYRFE
jgi:hypothetical protein